MKLITIRIPDNKLSFLMELLTHFSFIKLVKTEEAQQDEFDEHNDWDSISMTGFASAYGEDEPDYNNIQLQEPNSCYGSETR